MRKCEGRLGWSSEGAARETRASESDDQRRLGWSKSSTESHVLP